MPHINLQLVYVSLENYKKEYSGENMVALLIVFLMASATTAQSVLSSLSRESPGPNYWQLIPGSAIEACLLENSEPKMQHTIWLLLEIAECFYWKKESLLLHSDVSVSGIISFYSKPMGVLQWHWFVKTSFISYIYLSNKVNLGFNISFSEFSMGYSGSNCVYDKMLIETLNGLTATGQDIYCGIAPNWNHISLASSIRIIVETTGEYNTSIRLHYSPVNSNEYKLYFNKPDKMDVGKLYKFALGLGNKGLSQNIIKSDGRKSEKIILCGLPMDILYFHIIGKLHGSSVLLIYDGPYREQRRNIFTKFNNSSLLDIRGQSNGPILSVLYTQYSKSRNYPISLKVQAKADAFRKTYIHLRHNHDQQISSDDYCPSVNGITHCSLNIVAPRDSAPTYLFPNISNLMFTYKGPDIENCLYGVASIYFHVDLPVISLCREDKDMSFWNVIGTSNMTRLVMYSYNGPISLSFIASLSDCKGHISKCDNGEPDSVFKLSRCGFIYRFPISRARMGNVSCKISLESQGAVGLRIKRGKWNGKCEDQVKFGSAAAPIGYVPNTSIEKWPYLMPFIFHLSHKLSGEILSFCQWSLTWLQIHSMLYCGAHDIANMQRTQLLTFSGHCMSVQVPVSSGTYRHHPFYEFPSSSKSYSDWGPIDVLQLKCLVGSRKLCLSVHFVSRDSRCPEHCVNDTMRLIHVFEDKYFTDMDYSSGLLNNMTLILPQQRFKLRSTGAKRYKFHKKVNVQVHDKHFNKTISQYIFFHKRTLNISRCRPCNLYYNINIPVRNRSYLLENTPQYLDKLHHINSTIDINRTQDRTAVFSFQTKHHQYRISSLVNESWISANTSCGGKKLSLITMAQEDISDILMDFYSRVVVWELRKALPVFVFLGIQPDIGKVQFYLYIFSLIFQVPP